MTMPCACPLDHAPKLVAITGGPGAGKTAVLEVIQRHLCQHVRVLPEVASMLWRGGFPRHASRPCRQAAQRAIARVQVELQRMAVEEATSCLVVCDRGTLDGLAYWPGEPEQFFADLDTTREEELARYAAVIHMRVPALHHGYTHTTNPLRTETAAEAAALDDKILEAWTGHPRRFVIESNHDFLPKLGKAVELIRAEMPPCCRG